MQTLNQEMLDKTNCGVADCDHDHSVIYLHQKCHLGQGVYAKYVKATGLLHLACAICEKEVAVIQVEE